MPYSLPILCDKDNRERFDPEDNILDTGVYRDRWSAIKNHLLPETSGSEMSTVA